MKKIILFVLTIAIMLSLVGCGNNNIQDNKISEQSPQITENTSQNNITTKKLIAIRNVNDSIVDTQFEYDSAGQLIRCVSPKPDGDYEVKFTYEDGKIKKVDHIFESFPEMSYPAYEAQYNSDGHMISWVDREGGAVEYICETDENGNVIKAVCDSMYSSETIYYTYGENDCLVKAESSSGSVKNYNYDSEQNLISEVRTGKDYSGNDYSIEYFISYVCEPFILVEGDGDAILELKNELNRTVWIRYLEADSLVYDDQGYIIEARMYDTDYLFEYK